MAKFWVGGTGNWSDTTHWATSSGGAGSTGVPTSTDNVTFDTNSNATAYTVTVDVTANCANIVFGAPTAGNMTLAGSFDINCYGSWTFYSGLIITWFANANFVSTATGKTITSNGKQFPYNALFTGVGGGWQLQDNFACAFEFRHTSGTLDINGKTVTSQMFNCNGNGTRTLTLGAGFINASTPYYTSDISGTGLTLNAGTSTISLIGQGITLGANTFYNLTVGTLTKIGVATLSGNITCTGTFIAHGSSAINRLLIQSSALTGTRTITAATVGTCSNVDFMDILGAGAGNWNLSAISGGVGDCGGNSGITFTSAVTQYWHQTVTGYANWSDATKWFLATNGAGGAGRVPLPQDTANLDANSFTVSGCKIYADMPRVGSVNWTGVTNVPAWDLQNSPSVAQNVFGSITLSASMNSGQALGYQTLTLRGRGSYTITSAGQLWINSFILMCPGGTYTQQDDFDNSGLYAAYGPRGAFRPVAGTWNANGHKFTTSAFEDSFNGYGTSVAIFTMGSNTHEINGNDSTFTFNLAGVWQVSTTIINAGTSTLLFNDSSPTGKTIRHGGRNYNNVTIGGSGSGAFSCVDAVATNFLGNVVVNNTGGAPVTLCNSSWTTSSIVGSLDFTGFTGSTVLNTFPLYVYGNLTFYSAMTIGASTYGVVLYGNTSNAILVTNGKTIPFAVGTVANGSYVAGLGDNVSIGSGFGISLGAGIFSTNNFNLLSTNFLASTNVTRTINLGSSTITLTGSSNSSYQLDLRNGTNTVNPGTSTIKLTANSSLIKAIHTGGKALYNLWFNTLGTGQCQIDSSSTYNNIRLDPGVNFGAAAGTTQTVSTLTATGTALSNISLNSQTLGSKWYISCPSGTITCDYLRLRDSGAIGGATFQAGSNSVNVSNNTGWIFGTPPPPPTNRGGGFFRLML